jgi:hypothetical protein
VKDKLKLNAALVSSNHLPLKARCAARAMNPRGYIPRYDLQSASIQSQLVCYLGVQVLVK